MDEIFRTCATIIELLEKQNVSQEEQNELSREQNQLLGAVLDSLDTLANRSTITSSTDTNPIPNVSSGKGPVPMPDQKALDMVIFGTSDSNEQEIGTLYEFNGAFWPKTKAPPGWVRVSIKHPSEECLRSRIVKGCLCGRSIILKEHNGDSFYTCEALTQKGSCSYRPAAYFDKLTFLSNIPPAKE